MAEYTVDVKAKLDVSEYKQDLQNAAGNKPITVKVIPNIEFNTNIDADNLKNLQQVLSNYFTNKNNLISVGFKLNEDTVIENISNITKKLKENKRNISVDIAFTEDKKTKFEQDISKIQENLEILKKQERVNLKFGFDSEDKKTFNTDITNIKKQEDSISNVNIGLGFNQEQKERLGNEILATKAFLESFNADKINISIQDDQLAQLKNNIENYFQNNPIVLTISQDLNDIDLGSISNKVAELLELQSEVLEQQSEQQQEVIQETTNIQEEATNAQIQRINELVEQFKNEEITLETLKSSFEDIRSVAESFGLESIINALDESTQEVDKFIQETNEIKEASDSISFYQERLNYLWEHLEKGSLTSQQVREDLNELFDLAQREDIFNFDNLEETSSQGLESIQYKFERLYQWIEECDDEELKSQIEKFKALEVQYQQHLIEKRELRDKENKENEQHMHDAILIENKFRDDRIENEKSVYDEKIYNLLDLSDKVREKAQENVQVEEDTAQQTINAIKEITVEAQQQAIAEREIDDERLQKKQEIAEESKQLEKEASEVTKSELQGTLETVRQTLQERTNITKQALEDTKNLNNTINNEIESSAKQDSDELQRIYSENIEHLNYLYQNNSINFEKYAHDVMSTVKDAFKDGIIPEETVKKASDSLEEMRKKVAEANEKTLKQQQETNKKAIEDELKNTQDLYNKKLISAEEYVERMRNILPQAFEAGVNGAQQFQNSVDKVEKELQEATQDTNSFTEALNNFGSSSNNIFNSLMRYFGVTKIISGITNSFSKMVDEVKSLDVELTEFSKVSDLTSSQTERFISDAYELGSTIAKTGTEVVTATTLFKKMGYTVDESMKFAKDALMWTNVADGMVSVEEASNMLISTMKAFGEETVNTTQIIDALNEVSNNYSTSSSALSNNLSTVAATMAESGVSLEQTIGLMTAGIEIMPDKASKVANGLKTISQRIRQIDGDTADKLDEFLGSKGKSRFDEVTGQLKNTYDILTEFSDLWEDLTINERQYIGEVMAGKNQITVLNALMTNFATAVEATETAMNSAGSAATENIRVLNSIQGHINNFKSAFSELSNDLIDSNLLKRIIDIGTEIIRWLDDFIKSGRLPKIAESIIGIGTALETIQIAKTIAGFVESFDIWTLAVTACASAFSVLITAVTDFVNKTREAQEQADYFLKLGGTGLGEKYSKSIEDALKEYEKLKEKIDNASSKEEKSKYVDKLVNLQTELKNIGIEVDLISGKYEDQIKLLKQESEQQHLLALAEKEREYSDYQQSKNGSGGMLRNLIVENESFFTNGKGFSNLPTQYEQQINDAVQQLGESLVAGKTLEDILDSTELSIKEKRELIEQGYKEYLESSKYLTEQVKTATGEDTKAFYQQQADNYQRFAGILKQIFDDLSSEEAKYSEVVDEAKKVVRDKLENFGADLTKLTKEELASFKETIESGDLSEINIPLDELGMSFSQLKELISDPELKEAFLGLIDDEIIKKKAQKVIDSLSGIEEQTEFTLSGAIASMSDYAAQAEILAQAQEDITNSGVITAETLKKIADAGLEAYLTIDEETGSLVVNTQAFMDNNASIEDNAIAKYINYEKSKLDSEIEAILAGNIDASTESITNQTNALNTHGEAALTDAEKTAQSVLTQAQEMLLLGEITEDQFYAMQRAAAGYRDEIETGIAALRGYFGAVTQARTATSRGASHSGNSGSSSKSSSSTSDREAQQAQREAEQAAKNAQKAWKDAFEIEYKKLKTYLDAELITNEEYYDALEELNKHFFEGRAEFEEEYWKYQDEIIKGRKKYLEDELKDYFSKGEKILKHQLNVEYITEEEYYDALTLLYETYYTDKEKYEEEYWKLEEDIYKLRKKQIKELEDELSDLYKEIEDLHKNYIKSLEEDNKELETVIGYAVDVLDEEIEKLKAEKTALSEANEALEEQIKLQELEDALEKAKQKKIRVYRKGQGFVYEQDTKAVGEAQSAIDEYKKELAHKKQLSMIDEEIAKLEEYKKAWKDITENYKRSQNEMTASGILGENAREKILAREYNAVGLVGTQYESVRVRIEAANNATIDDLEAYIGDEATAGTFSYEIKRIKDKINEIQSKTVTLQVNTSNSVSNIQNVIDSINSLKSKLEQGYSTNNLDTWLASWKSTIDSAYQYSQQHGITPSTGGGDSGGTGGNPTSSGGFNVGDWVTLPDSDVPYAPFRGKRFKIVEFQDGGATAAVLVEGGTEGEITYKVPVSHLNTSDSNSSSGSSGGSSGGSSDYNYSGNPQSGDTIIGSDGEPIYVHAQGTLGTKSKTFMVNEEGLEAMVTPEGTVISAPSTGYGVIKNEYTERLTDFAADPMNFLNKTFSGYTGTYQNNPSTNEVININGNLNLPNVTDGQSFVDSIRNVALQYTTRRR